MKVFDVFPFFNELDVLEIRLNTLDDLVDEFIITEAETTFSGLAKPFFAHEALDTFGKFAHKITIQKVIDVPTTLTPFERDRYQRDQVKEILSAKLEDEDLLLYGDVDEIPKPETLSRAISSMRDSSFPICHFAQDIFYCYLNQKEVSGSLQSFTGEYKRVLKKKWLGTNLSRWSYSKRFLPTDLRNPEHKKVGVRLPDGGWHFSYVGSEGIASATERVNKKIISAAHQEYNTSEYLDSLDQRIQSSIDIFKRRRSRYRILKDFSYLPDYIQRNLSRYSTLIKKT